MEDFRLLLLLEQNVGGLSVGSVVNMLYGKSKGAVYKSYVRPAIMYGSRT